MNIPDCCLFSKMVSRSPGCHQTHYIANDSLKLLVLPPILPNSRIRGVDHHYLLKWLIRKNIYLYSNLKANMSNKLLQISPKNNYD